MGEVREIIEILKGYRKVVIVGISNKPERDSNKVGRYLKENGYDITPVNPTIENLFDIKAYPSVKDIPQDVDVEVVDIFRRPDAVPGIVEEAIERGAKVIWMQEGVINNEAAKRAQEAGLKVVMNRCMMNHDNPLPVAQIAEGIRAGAAAGELADPANLADDRVWTFLGTLDSKISIEVHSAAAELYAHFLPADQIRQVDDVEAEHVFPARGRGQSCTEMQSPFVGDCDYDGA